MPDIPDLSRPILYHDEETGETILGGEDSPRADALRRELAEKRKKMWALWDEQAAARSAEGEAEKGEAEKGEAEN